MTEFDAVSVGRRVLAVEAEALVKQAESLGPPFARAVEVLDRTAGRVVCMGVGKSGHVARKIAATLSSTGSPAMFVHPAEASHGDLGMINSGDVILMLSKSGEVRELGDTLAYAKRFAIPVVAITASRESALGRDADVVLLLNDAPEATGELNAPTTSTTLQMAIGDALAAALIERRGFTARDFHVFHPGGKIDAPMPAALLLMTEKRFGCVGVQDDQGHLKGLITDGDIRRHMDGLMSHTAREVMTPAPKTIAPRALAAEALKVMNDNQITVLFVVDDDKPVGILHIHDLLRVGVI
jgi:arabinose-5-phosphate isomerase